MVEYIERDEALYYVEYFGSMLSWTKEEVVSETARRIEKIPAADVVEVRRRNLRVEINTDCFGDTELAKERGWYRKFFYCPDCVLLLRTESWDERYMFGSGTVLKTNDMPNYCPNCGAKTDGKGGER